VQPVSRELAESFGLDKPRGALIGLVEKGGAADKAGLMAGDVILSVNGTPLNDTTDLPRIIGELGPGGIAALSVWRQKAARDVVVTLADASDGSTPAAPTAAAEGPLGLSVRELRPDEANALGVAGGLAVASATGIAARSGVQPGDVILAVNNQPVGNRAAFAAAVKSAGKRVALLIQRGASRIYVPLKMQ
jgi:serine protease Do